MAGRIVTLGEIMLRLKPPEMERFFQSSILEAEGQREAQLLKAEGYAAALQRIYSVAQDIDSQTMTLQYFEALKALGASPATKYIFPMEFTSLLENFVNRNKE